MSEGLDETPDPGDNTRVFRTFTIDEEAADLKELLGHHGIASEIRNNLPPVDVTFSGNTTAQRFEVRLLLEDFEKAEALLSEQAKDLMESVDKDYYLFEFTDEELLEILAKQDEWGAFDYELAQKILADRGKPVTEETLSDLKAKRLKNLAEPEQTGWITVGYISALLGGFLGIAIGYQIMTAKNTLPDGTRVYRYTKSNREDGKKMAIIGGSMFTVSLALWLFGMF